MEKNLLPTTELATFGGGCFWCTEALFQKIPGVLEVVSGYSAGHAVNPSYEDVCSGQTGHAEVVQIAFDNSRVSYQQLVQLHLQTHNPTTLNQQGADRGTQYRSILTHGSAQQRIAQSVIAECASLFQDAIVT